MNMVLAFCLLIYLRIAVLHISHDRMTDGCQMGADLMGTPGDQRYFEKRIGTRLDQRLIFRADGRTVRKFSLADGYLVCLFILL